MKLLLFHDSTANIRIAEIGRRDRSEKTLDQNSSNYADVLLEMHVYSCIYIPTGEEKYGGQTAGKENNEGKD